MSMAIIAGARTFHQVRATVRAGFMPVMKISWITSPLALAFAQKFLPEHTWVPFFNLISFVIGTYINSHTKKKRLAALRKKVCTPTDRALPLRTTSDMCSVALRGREKGGLVAYCKQYPNAMRRVCLGDSGSVAFTVGKPNKSAAATFVVFMFVQT